MPVRLRSRASSAARNSPRARLQRTQLIELLAVAVGDHAAVAHHRRGFLEHGPSQQREALHRDFQIAQHPREQRRAARNRGLELGQQGGAVTQRRQIARAGVLERDAPGDALDVGEAAQQLVDSGVSIGEGGNRFVARADSCLIAQGWCSQWRRSLLPIPLAHSSSREKSVGRAPRAEVSVSSRFARRRRRVHADVFARALGITAATWRAPALASFFAYSKAACGSDRGSRSSQRSRRGSPRRVLEQDLPPGVETKCHSGSRVTAKPVSAVPSAAENFCRDRCARSSVLEKMRRDLGDAQLAAREIEPRRTDEPLATGECEQDVVGLVLEQLRIGERSRRDDARHLPIDRSFRSRGGRPICSQIATDSPMRTSFARYWSTA